MAKRALFASAVTLLVLGNAMGLAQTVATGVTGSPSQTAFSGISGASQTLSKDASADQAIFGVEIAERSDDPCFLRVRYRHVATGEEKSALRFARCDDNNNDEGTGGSRRLVTLPSNLLVTGVRVCLNSDRDKMKGIQLLARAPGCVLGKTTVTSLPPDCSGTFKTTLLQLFGQEYRVCNTSSVGWQEVGCSDPASIYRGTYFERDNCRGTKKGPDEDWEREVMCPDRMVATGMLLSTRESGGNRRMIDGIALECHELAAPN